MKDRATSLIKIDDLAAPLVTFTVPDLYLIGKVPALHSFGQFAPQKVPAQQLLPSEDRVCLTDGTQVAKDKVEAIHTKLLKIKEQLKPEDGESKRFALHYLLIICEAVAEDRGFYLAVHKFEMEVFRDPNTEEDKNFPIIKSDNTIEEETRKILLCVLRRMTDDIEIVNPIADFAISVAPKQ